MKRQFFRLGLALVCACSALSGCDLLRHEQRVKSDELALAREHEHEERTEKAGAVESEPPKGFFSKSRLSGGLSSEARDVERNLGVP